MALQQAGVELVAKGLSGFTGDMAKSNAAVADFGKDGQKAMDALGQSVDNASKLTQDAAGHWRTSTGRFASDAEKAAAGVATVGDAATKTGHQVEGAGRGFSVFGEIAVGALRKVGEIAVDALGKAAQATGAFLKGSIDLAGDFQSGMQEFQSVAGKDVDTQGLEEFHDLFLQIGKELPVSTSEVQQAAIELVKGGIDPLTVSAGGLRSSIQFAAAAMDGDLKGAAEISAKVVGGWAEVNATAAEKAAANARAGAGIAANRG